MKLFSAPSLIASLITCLAISAQVSAAGNTDYSGPTCLAAPDDFFVNEVWGKVGARSCLECHKVGGDAEESDFILQDPARALGAAQADVLRYDREQFLAMSRRKVGEESRILLKAIGRLKHGGKDVLKPDSPGYRVLSEFVKRSTASSTRPAVAEANAAPFFDGVAMLDAPRLLRRVTLSLAGRLPTEAELAAVAAEGDKALPGLLDAVMKEDAFYDRLREGFNDIFLTVGITDNAEA